MKYKPPEGYEDLLFELRKIREMLSDFHNKRQKYWGEPFMSGVARLMGEIETLNIIVEKNK
jgi:hypothetical protein